MTTYTATAPDGTVFTRKSNRTYTHAVLVGPSDPALVREVYGREPEVRETTWGVLGWAGRRDLADKTANNPIARAYRRTGAEVRVVEVEAK